MHLLRKIFAGSKAKVKFIRLRETVMLQISICAALSSASEEATAKHIIVKFE